MASRPCVRAVYLRETQTVTWPVGCRCQCRLSAVQPVCDKTVEVLKRPVNWSQALLVPENESHSSRPLASPVSADAQQQYPREICCAGVTTQKARN